MCRSRSPQRPPAGHRPSSFSKLGPTRPPGHAAQPSQLTGEELLQAKLQSLGAMEARMTQLLAGVQHQLAAAGMQP